MHGATKKTEKKGMQKVGSGFRNKLTRHIDRHITWHVTLTDTLRKLNVCVVLENDFLAFGAAAVSLFRSHGLCNGSLPLYKTDVRN
jgi:hypothetical protein